MSKSRVQIQAESDAKRSMKVKGIKLHLDTIALLEQLADASGKPQNQIVTEAIELWADAHNTITQN